MNKILFFLQLPPSIHGSSMIGLFIKESKLINKKFNSSYINLGTSTTVDEINILIRNEKANGFVKSLTNYFE